MSDLSSIAIPLHSARLIKGPDGEGDRLVLEIRGAVATAISTMIA